ncbi:hypothetical protein [Streptomyces sp. ISL-100]|uniref:hypothetical protein n=1 Tax=Streptomyces sp. ISL-100 TaxID=2819173 RepID=UPI001BECFA03|nr:hypothetical protein [Streptomyces sp. ISL-100]MBT2399345.1 hypothetical protein [Streptomyces sp. ISL-100]
MAPLGASIAQSLRQAITQAETVLVVLGSPARSQSVLFEAGVAVGMGKRVVVITDPGEETPADLCGLLTIRARPDDLEAIGFALDQAEGRPAPGSATAAAVGRPLGAVRVDELLALLHEGKPRELRIIEILKTALEESGTVAVERPVHGTHRLIDLGVWSDDLDAIALNPLLIEVKRTLSRSAVDQTLRLLQSSRMQAALLVHLEPPPSQSEAGEALEETTFPVLTVSLPALLERMRTSSFAEVVRDLRNRAVHGVQAS